MCWPPYQSAAGATQAGIWQGDFNGHKPKAYNFEKAEQMMLSLFGILTFIFFMQTLRMNRALQARPRPWPCSKSNTASSVQNTVPEPWYTRRMSLPFIGKHTPCLQFLQSIWAYL